MLEIRPAVSEATFGALKTEPCGQGVLAGLTFHNVDLGPHKAYLWTFSRWNKASGPSYFCPNKLKHTLFEQHPCSCLITSFGGLNQLPLSTGCPVLNSFMLNWSSPRRATMDFLPAVNASTRTLSNVTVGHGSPSGHSDQGRYQCQLRSPHRCRCV